MAQVVKPEPRHTCSRHQAVERLGETVRMDGFPVRMSNHTIFSPMGRPASARRSSRWALSTSTVRASRSTERHEERVLPGESCNS